MAYTQTYAYPGREEREGAGGYADLSGKNTFEHGHQAMFGNVHHHQQQPYQHQQYQHQQAESRDRFYDQRQYQASQQAPGYPSYAPYVSDEERVLALLSSSSSDNLRGLESNLGMMSSSYKTQYSGNDSVDWYGSPYYAYADEQDNERYLDQAREVDLDIYHPRQQEQSPAVVAEGYRSWADLGYGQTAGSFGVASAEEENDFPSAYKPAAAFQPFAEEETIMEDDYEYGEDEYDGQNQLSRSQTLQEGLGSFSSVRDFVVEPVRQPQQEVAASNSQAMPFQQQQQQQYGGEYYGNDQYPYTKASHLPRGGVANPFGAVGSETVRFDSVPRQTQEQVSMDQQQAYSLAAQVGGKAGAYEVSAYGQDAAAPYQQQNMQVEQLQPVVEEVAITSGVGLSGWLAEAVWQLCTVPFEPIGGKQMPADATFGNDVDFTYYSPRSRNWSGFSSPDVVSYRELYDPASGYASPIVGSPSSRFASNPFGLRSKPSQAFVEFVHRTLSQTLLSPTAVVLSLWYIKRLAIHSGGAADGIMLRQMLHRSVSDMNGCGGEEAVQRILTLGLACSNKWLDDNTFTNKSWSDVTLLPLAEINSLELYALGPLKFDLSISVMEWDEWLCTVNQGLTPFVTDGLAVASAINAMRRALAHGNAKFETDIVSRRGSNVSAVMNYETAHPMVNSHSDSMVLPPISSIVDARHLRGSVPNASSSYAMTEYGSSALDYGSQSYGWVNNDCPETHYPGQHNAGYGHPSAPHQQQRRGSALPPVASTLPPPQMASSIYPSSSVRGQARRERHVGGVSNTANNSNASTSSASSYNKSNSGSSAFVSQQQQQQQQDGSIYPSYSGHQYYLSHLASSHQPRFMSVMA